MDAKTFARVGAIAFVAVAITATAIELSRKSEPAENWTPRQTVAAPLDPLRGELLRCQALGEAGPRDSTCLSAWAENRNRFLAPGSRPAESLSSAPTPPLPTATPSEAR